MTDKSEPAFPVMGDTVSKVTGIPYLDCKHEGMSLRDYFAAKAMQAIIANRDTGPFSVDPEGVSLRSFKIADAMLAAREALRNSERE